jgi:molecular chaperone HtpG
MTTDTNKQSMPFQAEVKEILNLMIHSLYSQKEIFLRELISNASDALDKLRFESLTHKEWQVNEGERGVAIIPDERGRTLKIQDNGIGMSYDEVVKNIGTIAHSGTREFLRAKQELKDRPELIGQFGVGFYSSFMVADRVTLHTQKAGESDGTLWESSGDGEYTITKVPRPGGHGTSITLHLRDFSGEENPQSFTDEWTLRGIIKKYSDFISYPITLRVMRPKDEKAEVDVSADVSADVKGGAKPELEAKDETINSQKALWLRSPGDIKPEEYKEFYHHIAHDWNEPQRTIHFRAEGTQEFAALMYIPKEVPFDFNHRETKFGLSLYIKRVFIMDHCEDLQPHYLRFVRGMVDSNDLPLNVSREILQKDVQVQRIQKAVVGKALGFFKDMLIKERKDYEFLWERFGTSLKEGFVTDRTNRDKLADLLLLHSSTSNTWITLGEYVERMKPEQKAIYFLSGDSIDLLKNSPYLERLKDKGFEVVFLTDTIDEWVARELTEYKGKKFISIAGDELDLDTDEEKKSKEVDKKKAEEKFGGLKKMIEESLKEQLQEVRFSDRLVDSPVCLVSLKDDPSARMSRLMESMGKSSPKIKRILEINPKHALFERLVTLPEPRKLAWIEILYNQALLNEGSPIQDPAKFSRQIADLMVGAEL